MRQGLTLIAAALVVAWSPGSPADPAVRSSSGTKHPDFFVGYSGTRWERDYDVLSGHCDREAIGVVFGHPAGAMLGASFAPRENRAAATLIGATLDSLVASKVGQILDAGDRACLGHALEIGRAGRRVVWDNPATGVHYEMVPDDGRSDFGGFCRDFKLVAAASAGKSKRHGTACEKGPGLWQLSQL
jgi:surface antigen